MNNDSRLPPRPGEWIDRGRPVRFLFEGQPFVGYAGDTISTALWANGVHVLGRSFKYHRPRGLFSLSDCDANAIMETEERTNIRADLTPIEEGLSLRAVNTRGGVQRDFLGVLDLFGAFTPVGFYYKAFHTPRSFFRFYENRFRELAGLGRVRGKNTHRHTPKEYAFCDVLVVGSGPAGLSAALAAAESGARVMLVEREPHCGGTLLLQDRESGGADVLSPLIDKIRSSDRIELRTSTTAVGYYADHWIALADKTRLTKLRAKAVIVASGCDEQPAVFHNNDLPGILLGSAVQRLMRLYAVKPFSRGVVLTANADGYQTAADLHRTGISVAAIADLRPGGEASSLAETVQELGIPVHTGFGIHEAVPKKAKKGVREVLLRPLDSDGSLGHDRSGKDARSLREVSVPCDGVAVSVGWAPADGLLRQGKTVMQYSDALEQFVPEKLPPGLFAAGRVNGIYDLDHQLEDGRRAGVEAAKAASDGGEVTETEASSQTITPSPEREGPPRSHPYPVFAHPKGKNFVDLDEDIQLKDFENAFQEGFDNVELLKRYSTFGMGPSQGRHSNLLALRILARHHDSSLHGKQMTTARPFTTPVSLAHLAGRIFTPVRRTPMHAHHERLGAAFMYAGNWLRPEFYRREGLSREECIRGEAENVRQRVGLIDLSTLGKIEVSGPDAVTFLERIYTGRFARLQVGRARYGVACDETGVVIDDGVVSRLSEERFYVSTTTSGAAAIYRELKRWNLQWRLNVVLVNATDHYAAVNLAGPRSREVLKSLTEIDLDLKAFPYMSAREGTVAGFPARVTRVGFVGELGYEVHVPAEGAPAVWDAILRAGARDGIRPFGVEAQRLLRLEKGHVIVGQDTDGLTQPLEAGMAWAVKMDKPFFVGQRSLSILEKQELRRCLVGFTLAPDYEGPLPKECHLVINGDEIAGRVTSVGFSASRGQVIGLAYVKPTQKEPGTAFKIRLSDGALVEATVSPIPFYDPENERQNPAEALRSESRPRDQETTSRQSPLESAVADAKPVWDTCHGMRVPMAFSTDLETLEELSLCDLSALPKIGVKGPGAASFLQEQGLVLPGELYGKEPTVSDGLVLRVDSNEYFLEEGISGKTVEGVSSALGTGRPGLCRVERQDAGLLLSGAEAFRVLRQTCAYPFEPEKECFVMTRVAQVSCAVLQERGEGAPFYRIWCAPSSGSYLWETLLEIVQELGGKPVGLSCYLRSKQNLAGA